ncbi:MAG: sensor domain-containing diguanylate cyclase [Gammaproteobacteria bacterium]|nr:sensor domain-containing diguanylate cyclase [Gammaproteobacteria bacterium]MBU1350775.1 sensor domain-containing diguanylate cyclase [Gammaproteobacteria bacterium]MBU1508628.1 sensor domain-containing diguanylate cyclase [Gammaproteobacteria bacterium]MBU2119959.1 sensor domain-containing diguanylate cyclase [Gammaproteobacteria bacterium]MBU2171978.1 sensor domain-containing diguanylate cyclase [Gammaproteobacteria bacterium]
MLIARFADRGLRMQIALVFGTLVVMLSVLLSLAFGELFKRRLQRDAGESLQMVAENAGKLLANGLLERSREAEVLASAEVIWTQGLEAPEAQHLLARSQATRPSNLWIGVADAQGVVRSATNGMLVGQSVSERPWFKAGIKEVHVGDVHPAKLLEKLLPPLASGEPYRFVDFAAPIRLGPTTVGVLGIHGSWEWTREVLESLTPPRSDESSLELFIFDREGEMILAPSGQTAALQAAGQRLPEGLHINNNRDGGRIDTAVVRWQDQQRYLTAATQLQPRNAPSDLGWLIVARQPVELAFAEANRTVRMTLAMGLIAALLASALAWMAARRLSEDLDALANAASAVEAGKPGADIPAVYSNREVTKLSVALGRMTHRLLAAREAMEEKVRLRTLELEAANRALDLQARTDALTGLLNRRGFETQMAFGLAMARRSGRPLSLITVDVDHFKRVNDTYGHEAGDEVLRRLARTLEERLRGSDVIARLGGEEFVVLLPDTDLAGAQAIAQAVVQAMADQQDPVVGSITVSAGVASMRGLQDNGTDILRRGDAALYEAKGQGRNRVCVEA